MSSSYTSSNKLEKPATGEQSGTWGQTVDNDLDLIDQALDGYAQISVPSTGSIALNIANGQSSAARSRSLVFVGSPSASITVQIVQNTVPRWWFAYNNTSQQLVFTGAGSTTAILKPNAATVMLSDGQTGVYDLFGSNGYSTYIRNLIATVAVASPSFTGGAMSLTGAVNSDSVTAHAITGDVIAANSSITSPSITTGALSVTNFSIGNVLSVPNISTPGDVQSRSLTAVPKVASYLYGLGAPNNTTLQVDGGVSRGKVSIMAPAIPYTSPGGASRSPIFSLQIPGSGPLDSGFAGSFTPGNDLAASLTGSQAPYMQTDYVNRKISLMSNSVAPQYQGGYAGTGVPMYVWYYTVIL